MKAGTGTACEAGIRYFPGDCGVLGFLNHYFKRVGPIYETFVVVKG